MSRPPRIKVVGLRVKGRPTLYCVSDGMHRTIAAREAGKRTIRAEIEGWHICEPAAFFLWWGQMWKMTADGAVQLPHAARRLNEHTVIALENLGVRIIPDHEAS